MSAEQEPFWVAYAVTGRPDFLNYLRRGDVTWSELWAYYHRSPADPGAMLRLSGLFHIFLSHDYDREGGVLDRDGSVYRALSEWARFAVACTEFLPEEKVCEGLAALLGDSLISPLYFEAAFSTYMEALVTAEASAPAPPAAGPGYHRNGGSGGRALRLLLPDLSDGRVAAAVSGDAVSSAIRSHYGPWNVAYLTALGQEQEDWLDEGGEG